MLTAQMDDEEGVVLGGYVGERVFLGRTFITYDMAHEGTQADTPSFMPITL